MKKYEFNFIESQDEKANAKLIYLSRFKDLFLNEYDIEGLDPQQVDFILKEFWEKGQVGCIQIKNMDDMEDKIKLAFTPFAPFQWNIYNFPIEAQCTPKKPVPFIPTKKLEVNKEIVISYALRSRMPIKSYVAYLCDKIVEDEILIAQNKNALKMPFFIQCSPIDKPRFKNAIDKIINGDFSIFLDSDDPIIKAYQTNTPVLFKEVMDDKKSREGEILTYLGIDNVDNEKKEHLIVDEANSNNDLINANAEVFFNRLEEFVESINTLFGASLKAVKKHKKVTAVNEQPNTQMEGDGADA